MTSSHSNLGLAQQDTPTLMAKAAANRVLSLARRDIQVTYGTMTQILSRMAALPGQRVLILVSSGFPQLQQELWAGESQIVDLAARSNVTISALDARGLYTTSLTASDHNSMGSPHFRTDAMASAGNAMAELADGTGGTLFHNSNDLDCGLKSLIEAPEVVYVLELSTGQGEAGRHLSFLESERGQGRREVTGASRLFRAQAGEKQEVDFALRLRDTCTTPAPACSVRIFIVEPKRW